MFTLMFMIGVNYLLNDPVYILTKYHGGTTFFDLVEDVSFVFSLN